jgi:hypothetical protein
MYTIAIMFFVCFMFGMPLAFSDYFESVERYEFVMPLQVPESMVFWTECEDAEFWPEVTEQSGFSMSNLHFALVHFWNELPSMNISVAPERTWFPEHLMSTPVLGYSYPETFASGRRTVYA